jgi:membrane-associated phospholipid phosphatase
MWDSFTLSSFFLTEKSKMKRIIPLSLVSVLLLWTSGLLFAQSPYKISWEKDTYILGIGSTTAIGGYFLDNSVTPLSPADIEQLSRETINMFDRSAAYNYSETASSTSDILRNILAVAPLALIADKSIQNDLLTIGVMFTEVAAYVAGTNLTSKGSIQRIRPFVYNPNAPRQEKLTADAGKSFFSGHTTIAFASAVFLSTVYGDYNPNSEWKPYICAGSLLTASVVGYLRYEAGKHYPTDILVGAFVGGIIGYAIPWMHREGNRNVSLIPGSNRSDYGFSIQMRF